MPTMTTPEQSRSLWARWIILADVEFETAAQVGSNSSDYCDQTFERTEDGLPILRGSTIAGLLRGRLADRLGGYRLAEPKDVRTLFGDLSMSESQLIVFDSISYSSPATAIRDGVSIESKTGLAKSGFKYDREVMLPANKFGLRFELLIPSAQSESALLGCLAAALSSLEDGQFSVGALTSRGMGKVAPCRSWRAKRFALAEDSSGDGWLAYALSDTDDPLKGEVIHGGLGSALRPMSYGLSIDQVPDIRSHATIGITFDLAKSTLLIRSPGLRPSDPDVIHLMELGKSLISGTSLAGVLRSQCLRIANTINLRDAESFVDQLFGFSQKGKGSAASRVLVDEAQIANGSVYRQSKTKIDRLTGGSYHSALYDEAPTSGGSASVSLRLLNPTAIELALLELSVRDLCQGFVSLGGGGAVGRGSIRGTYAISKPEHIPDYEERNIKLWEQTLNG